MPIGAKQTGARFERLAVGVGLLVLTVASLIWIERDHTVWPWDQAWYGQTTLDLWAARSQGLHAWVRAMITAMGAKPPLLPWVAQFFIPLSHLYHGRIEPALLLFNVVCQAATFILVFRLARRIGCGAIDAWAGALIASGGSLVFGVADQFLVEPILCATCVLLMWAAWGAAESTGTRLVSGLACTTALGFLAKASAFTFIAPYLTYAIVARLAIRREAKRDIGGSRIVPVLAVVAVVACVAWYVVNWAPMRQHFIDATSDDVALLYGSVGSLGSKVKFWTQAAAVGLSPWPWLAVVPVAVILVGLASRIPALLRLSPAAALNNATRSGWLFAGASAGLLAVTLFGMSFQIEEETRFVVTIYAPLGIATAWALAALRRRWLSALTATVFALNTVWNIGISEGRLDSPAAKSVWLKPYDTDTRDMSRLRAVVAQTCPPSHDPNYRVIGVEYPSFNANSASFYASIQRRTQGTTCPYTALGYAETDMQRALTRLDQLLAQEIIFIAPARQPPANAFNAVSLAVADSLRSNPGFELIVSQNGEIWTFIRLPGGSAGARTTQ